MTVSTRMPHGWFRSGSDPQDYEMGVDRETCYSGEASGFVRSRSEPPRGFATLMQHFKADRYRGSRLALSAWIKTERVSDWAGLWLRIDGPDGESLSLDNMQNRPIVGTVGWKQYHAVLDVPADAGGIAFGVLLRGEGCVWIDEVRFQVVSEEVPTTGLSGTAELPIEPTNLDFEEHPDYGDRA